MLRYDPADYAAELMEMADMGMDTKTFITKSAPSLCWFRKHVRPIATTALCHVCRKRFNPAETGSMSECQLPRCSDSPSLKMSKGNGGKVSVKVGNDSRKLFAGQK